VNRKNTKTIGKHREVVEKPLCMCISEILMHVAALYRGTPDQSSRNSRNKFRLARPPRLQNFVALRQKVSKISVVEKICFPEKYTKVHPRSPDVTSIDRRYTSFYKHSVVSLALDRFVSEISLVLYRTVFHFCTDPLVFHSKFGNVPPDLDR